VLFKHICFTHIVLSHIIKASFFIYTFPIMFTQKFNFNTVLLPLHKSSLCIFVWHTRMLIYMCFSFSIRNLRGWISQGNEQDTHAKSGQEEKQSNLACANTGSSSLRLFPLSYINGSRSLPNRVQSAAVQTNGSVHHTNWKSNWRESEKSIIFSLVQKNPQLDL
jgi:hypothetical protein